tara:strand:- start:1064 stop:1387 length:324 start_codon:yes stop_codon:yes gene_type:complete
MITRSDLLALHERFAQPEVYGAKPWLTLENLSVFKVSLRILRDSRTPDHTALECVASRWEQELDKIAYCSEYQDFYVGIIRLLCQTRRHRKYYFDKLQSLLDGEDLL